MGKWNLVGDELGRKALLCAALALVLFGGIILTHWEYYLGEYPEHSYGVTPWWRDYTAEVHQEWCARCESLSSQGVPTDCGRCTTSVPGGPND